MDGNRGRMTPPVNVGDELNVRIEAVGEKGDGIAKKDGFVLFVPNVKEGDEVKVRVTKVLRKVGFAEVVGQGSRKANSEEGAQEEEMPAEEEAQEEMPQDSDSFGEDDSSEESPEMDMPPLPEDEEDKE